MNNEQLTINQFGLSSMVILIIVIFAIAISWEISVYVDQYMSGEQLEVSKAKKCIGSDPRDCDDTFEGANTPIELSEEEEIWGWIDDGKP